MFALIPRIPPRPFQAIVTAGIGLATSSLASAQGAERSCPPERLFVAPDAIGVEGEFSELKATLRLEGGDAGELPIAVARSSDTACTLRAKGFTVRPLEPLVPGARYVLELAPKWSGCSSVRQSPLGHVFAAESSVPLPDSLPAPDAPELMASGCPPRPESCALSVPNPDVGLPPELALQLSVNGQRWACSDPVTIGVPCQAGARLPFTLRWIAGLPHTGHELLGPPRELSAECDNARLIDTCPANVGAEQESALDAAAPARGEPTSKAPGHCAYRGVPVEQTTLPGFTTFGILALIARNFGKRSKR
jgi:hypothetical protein